MINIEQVEKLLTYSFIRVSIENVFGNELNNIHYTEIDIPSIDNRKITSEGANKYMSENYFHCAIDKVTNLEEILLIIADNIGEIESVFKDKEEKFKEDYKKKFGIELKDEKINLIDTISNNCKYIITWLMYIISNNNLKSNNEVIIKSFRLFLEQLANINLTVEKNDQRFLYNDKKINIKLINSVHDFTEMVYKSYDEAKEKDVTICYRGHYDRKFRLLPSILRKNYLKKEDELYHYIQVKCPNEFTQCKTHLEKLVMMQHFGAPTRLLDITFNPLVALYFACLHETVSGEIIMMSFKNNKFKKLNSDTVSILSSLSALKYESKDDILKSVYNCMGEEEKNIEIFNNNNSVKVLVNEINIDKPSFKPLIKPKDIISVFPVYALQNNQRIARQDGGFLIYGLDNSSLLEIAEKCTVTFKSNSLPVHFIISKNSKKRIQKELKILDIKNSSLFPDIKSFAEDIIG